MPQFEIYAEGVR